MAAEHALKRISTDQDVAGAAVFLLGDGARQVSGQDIAADAGRAT